MAFKNPTTKLEETEDEPSTRSTKQSRQLKRAAEWRDQQEAEGSKGSRRDQEEAAEDRKGEKQYMTPAEKRRLAAIKGETHDEAVATTNAYVVFAYRRPSAEGEGANATEGQMDPFAAAQEAAAGLDGTIFAEHAIRADRSGQPQSADRASSATEPRLSVFVGNLDFASSEDALRAFFEKVLQEEQGHRQTGNTLGDETSAKANGWVSRVRIVRDRDSQLGKGFAYVQFAVRFIFFFFHFLLVACLTHYFRIAIVLIPSSLLSPKNYPSRNGPCAFKGAKSLRTRLSSIPPPP